MTQNELPFLFIHGAGGTKSKWRLIEKRLSREKTIFVDLPGHGSNTDSPGRSIQAFAETLSSMIGDDVIVVGHSMGGLIGIETAAKNPHVKALVLVASHYELPVHNKILSSLADGIFPDSLFYASYRKPVDEELLEQEKDELSLVPVETAFLDFSACNLYSNGHQTISELRIPILGIYGVDDRLLPPTARDDLVAANTLTSAISIEEAGHYVMLEKPSQVAQALTQFRESVLQH